METLTFCLLLSYITYGVCEIISMIPITRFVSKIINRKKSIKRRKTTIEYENKNQFPLKSEMPNIGWGNRFLSDAENINKFDFLKK